MTEPKRRKGRLRPGRPPFRWLVWTLFLPVAALLLFLSYGKLRERPLRTDRAPATNTSPVPVKTTTSVSARKPTKPQRESSAKTARPRKQGRVAIILDDAGFRQEPLRELARLGVPLSFAVLPNAPGAKAFAEEANERGFEVLCHLPLEPLGTAVSPGAGAITTAMSDTDIFTLSERSIRSIPHARGVNNHMGSRATADRRTMQQVLAAVQQTGTYFVDSRTTSSSVAASMARELDIRTASRDVFLDDDESVESVRRQLRLLIEVAESRGDAIGIGHLYPTTLRVLREELPRLRARGIEFVVASELVR